MSRKIVLLFVLLLIFASRVIAQQPFACDKPTGSAPPAIIFHGSPTTAQDAKQFEDDILHYLTITNSVDGLETALSASMPKGDFSGITAQVIQVDITGDKRSDVLTDVNVDFGPFYEQFLNLITCTDTGYKLLDALTNTELADSGEQPPTAILNVTDINNNHLPDIILYTTHSNGMLPAISIEIYEWDGKKLAQTFVAGPDLALAPQVGLVARDDNPALPELVLENHYGYGQSVESSIGEIPRWRPIDEVYRWNGTSYDFLCRYFSDQPATFFEALHSAEAFRECGDYDSALADYQQLWDGDQLTPWDEGVNIVVPDSVTDPFAYAGTLERAYLRVFAAYRMIQLAIVGHNMQLADSRVTILEIAFPVHQHGYNYAAMAKALLESYQQNGDLTEACNAAEAAYHEAMNTGDDPGLAYYETPPGSDYDYYGFYQYGDVRLSSDPDNLFDVPAEISDMIHIPVCLE
jgi:tetratricopeptide (TPR) repeat protein